MQTQTGAIVTMRPVVEIPSDNTRVFTICAPGPGGNVMPVMKLTYTRRK